MDALRRPLICGGLLLLALSAGCGRDSAAKGSSQAGSSEDPRAAPGPPGAPAGPSFAAGADDDPLPAPRRPSRRFVLAHGGDQCVVYWEDGDQRSKPEQVRCPREVLPGESIRLTGRVCLREGGGRSREVPVRCPDRLVFLEIEARHDAGIDGG